MLVFCVIKASELAGHNKCMKRHQEFIQNAVISVPVKTQGMK
jgi:hypothetical protein